MQLLSFLSEIPTVRVIVVCSHRFLVYIILYDELMKYCYISSILTMHLSQVVGGMDEHLPSLPQAAGVKLISYSKLLNQVKSASFFECCFLFLK